MNPSYFSLKKFTTLRLLVALVTLASFSGASAQTAAEPPQRWLFVFDTSSAMKSRLPAVTAELKNLFISSFSGQLRTGDSIGVWTFNRKINAGEFPLATWSPQFAASISSNIISYLGEQHYSGDTTFAALKPTLSRVIDNSERLTIVIFCDGNDTLKLTPYDDGINQAFKQRKAERASLNQTFALVIRTQRGAFIGATVNFPPGFLDLPTFPPLPVPPPIQPMPTNPPSVVVVGPTPTPAISLPPLVIVGTNVGTNIDDLPKIVPPPRVIVTNPPPVVIVTNVIIVNTNATVTAVASNSPATSAPAATIVPQTPAVVSPTTNTIAAASSGDSNGDSGTRNLILIGIGLLVAAIVLVLFLVLQRPRAARESLITSSMQDDSRPSAKK